MQESKCARPEDTQQAQGPHGVRGIQSDSEPGPGSKRHLWLQYTRFCCQLCRYESLTASSVVIFNGKGLKGEVGGSFTLPLVTDKERKWH